MLASNSRSPGCSGTRMGAWVRIPLRADPFCTIPPFSTCVISWELVVNHQKLTRLVAITLCLQKQSQILPT
uniref:Uncharacterized protein n=1 Tax=Caenorhabditis japonica TaxID=281687 RepID=A0A8R1IRV7_CAEJA